MNADNSHAERQIVRRAVSYYDTAQGLASAEYLARGATVCMLAQLLGCDHLRAAELLANALATRAASRG